MSHISRAIIVDDEESARDVLENLLNRFCPSVKVINKYANLLDAVSGIKELQPDVVFLDIEMPNYSGHEILDFFDDISFEIVFATAYNHYAVKAFEVSAVDYLLKPIDIERLKEAVDKVQHKVKSKNISKQYEVLKESLLSDRVKNLIVSDKGEQHIIAAEDIYAIKAQESYSCLYTEKGKYLVSKNLKHFEGLLNENENFFRK